MFSTVFSAIPQQVKLTKGTDPKIRQNKFRKNFQNCFIFSLQYAKTAWKLIKFADGFGARQAANDRQRSFERTPIYKGNCIKTKTLWRQIKSRQIQADD